MTNAKDHLEKQNLWHRFMKKILVKRVLVFGFAMAALVPKQAIAATWVKVADRVKSTFKDGVLISKDKRVVYYVDVSSIITHNRVTFFNRKADHMRLKNGYWSLDFSTGDSISADKAMCDKRMISIGKNWYYRAANGEWWSELQLRSGHRGGVSPGVLQYLGYKTMYELNRSDDEFYEGHFRLVCGTDY